MRWLLLLVLWLLPLSAQAQQIFNPVDDASTGSAAPSDGEYWVGAPNGTLTNEKDLSGFSGLVMNTLGTPSAYAGTSCTNQVLRALDASGAGTCITITSSYIDSSIVPSTRNVNTTAPLAGGGALSGDLTLTTSMATSRLLGRVSGGAGVAEELTGTQATTLLDVFTDVLKGLAPASGGGTTNFLRADGTWAAPGGGAGHTILSATHTDTLADTVVRGDILRGNSTPAWSRLALGGSNLYLKSNGTDVLYSTLAAGGVGSCTNQFVTALNADAAPTCTTATLASAQFANQGTTTTVLHGNAAGNPSFAAVNLANDTTGTLAIGKGGTGQTTITTNQVYVGTALDTLAAKTLPSCSNATTSKLLYDNATQTFSCGTDQTGSGSFSVTETEIDFGDAEVYFQGTFTVTDAGVSASSKILVSQSGAAATSRDEDENEMDGLILRASPGTGQFTLYVDCPEGCHGKFKVNYSFS